MVSFTGNLLHHMLCVQDAAAMAAG